MSIVIEYREFQPRADEVRMVEATVANLLELSPSDCHFEAKIAAEPQVFCVEFTVHYAGGQFLACARRHDLAATITEASAVLTTQLKKWSSRREFPETAIQGIEIDEAKQNVSKALRVLVVDDDVESIMPLQTCLRNKGCSVKVVNSGFGAIQEVLADDVDYDLIVIDWNMPEMTGGQAVSNAQKVISHSPSAKFHWHQYQMPVVVFSSCSADEVNLPLCRDFKFVDHWEKEVSFRRLEERVTDTLEQLNKAPIET